MSLLMRNILWDPDDGDQVSKYIYTPSRNVIADCDGDGVVDTITPSAPCERLANGSPMLLNQQPH